MDSGRELQLQVSVNLAVWGLNLVDIISLEAENIFNVMDYTIQLFNQFYSKYATTGLHINTRRDYKIILLFLIRFISRSNHCYLERKVSLNIKICKYLVPNKTNMSYFYPLRHRGREPQLQVSENFSYLI